ncbi:MAG: hypothetical protein FJ387_05575 [Verrucomicrobia bacterium]|nr:hypothetical protein [Verrucomicrobiota bacterium]
MANETGTSGSAERRRPSVSQTFGLDQYRFTKGKWLLLAAAGLMVVLGLAFGPARSTPAEAGSASADTGAGLSASDLLGSSFAEAPRTPRANAPDNSSAPGMLPEVSAFLVKGGFGLFVGFAIGFAIRSFVRLALVLAGCYLLLLSLMAYAGWVEIHWDAMQAQFDRSVTTLGEEFTSFKAFLSGAVPASGMTALGLTFGLRKG